MSWFFTQQCVCWVFATSQSRMKTPKPVSTTKRKGLWSIPVDVCYIVCCNNACENIRGKHSIVICTRVMSEVLVLLSWYVSSVCRWVFVVVKMKRNFHGTHLRSDRKLEIYVSRIHVLDIYDFLLTSTFCGERYGNNSGSVCQACLSVCGDPLSQCTVWALFTS